MKSNEIYYSDYLKLDTLLNCQQPINPVPAHDEQLFIAAHQTYELWFKQILSELCTIQTIFRQAPIAEADLTIALRRLKRINEIQNLLNQQISVLETMTPLDFLEFRDSLYPSSGMQSVQAREIEIRLGLLSLPQFENYFVRLTPHLRTGHIEHLQKCAGEKNLFQLISAWLERIPFIDTENFHFWADYHKTVSAGLAKDKQRIAELPGLDETERDERLREHTLTEEQFAALFDEQRFKKDLTGSVFNMSQRAVQAALFIQLHREEPVLTIPFQFLSELIELDELMATWRYRHSIMAQRMLGRKMGTGGTSGYQYLKRQVDTHRIYADLCNLSTFLLPRSKMLALPDEVKTQLGFFCPSRAHLGAFTESK